MSQKRYPKRMNKLYREIDIHNVHKKCTPECHFNVFYLNNIPHFIENDVERCPKKNKLARGHIHLVNFDKDNPKTDSGELIGGEEIVLNKGVDIRLNYPMRNAGTFTVNSHRGITRAELIHYLKMSYRFVYELELQTCNPITYTYIENCRSCGVEYIKYILRNRNNVEGQDCVICMENEGVSIKLDCGHSFHIKCLEEWINRENNSCPICRDIINKCKSCGGKLTIEREYTAKVIPLHHRIDSDLRRNTTDGVFGIYDTDYEYIRINRIFYSLGDNKIYLKCF
jgi:hypothetical protein